MFDVIKSLKELVKLKQICIDNHIFRMHYKVTWIILVAFSVLVTSRQYIGDPINCITNEIPAKVMDTYCWIYSTFTIPNRLTGIAGRDVVQPGVGSHVEDADEVKYHKYYQWVCFVLFFQAIFFYLPHYLWKSWEGGRIQMLVSDLNSPVVNEGMRSERKRDLAKYFADNINRHNSYAYHFFICEALNFVNVVGQICFMDFFLDGEFSTYGIDVLRFTEMDPDKRVDPMARVFPKVTKCTFRKYGPSGSIQTFDALCVLPLNILNEKIYVILWFWFIILSVLSSLSLGYRIAIFMWPRLRVWRLRARSRILKPQVVKIFTNRSKIGDWFVLYQLAKNIDPLIYKEVIEEFVAAHYPSQNAPSEAGLVTSEPQE